MDCNLPSSSVHEILQARILGWVASALLQVCVCVYMNFLEKSSD